MTPSNKRKLSNNDAAAGVVPIPRTMITVSIEIDTKNVGAS